MEIIESDSWAELNPAEQKRKLFLKQKAMLEQFLEKGAISRAQFEKSFGDLKQKMGFDD